MTEDWQRALWGDLALLEYGKALRVHGQQGGGARVYGTNGPIGWNPQRLGDGPTVVIGRKGAYRGVHYSPGPFWVIDTAYWLRPLMPLNMRWAYYQLVTQDINSRDSGSAIPSLSRPDFYSMRVLLPPLYMQDAIAALLGALDDKIDSNSHVVAAAEGLAIAYMRASPTFAALGDIAEPMRDLLSVDHFAERLVDHFSLPAFDAGAIPQRCSGKSIKSSKFLLSEPVVLVSKLNPRILRVWHAVPGSRVLALASTEFVVLSPRAGVTSEELWASCATEETGAQLAEGATGTTGSHQRVRPDDVLQLRIADPRSIADNRRRLARLLVRQAAASRAEFLRLAALRDALLPPLLDGRLRVRDAETLVAEAT